MAIILEACMYFYPMLVISRNNLCALTLLRVPSGRWLMYYDSEAPFFIIYARKFNHLFLILIMSILFDFFLKVPHCSHGFLGIIQITTALLPYVCSSHVRKLFSIHCQEWYYTDDEEHSLIFNEILLFLNILLSLKKAFLLLQCIFGFCYFSSSSKALPRYLNFHTSMIFTSPIHSPHPGTFLLPTTIDSVFLQVIASLFFSHSLTAFSRSSCIFVSVPAVV